MRAAAGAIDSGCLIIGAASFIGRNRKGKTLRKLESYNVTARQTNSVLTALAQGASISH
jgi:hypothetical protein